MDAASKKSMRKSTNTAQDCTQLKNDNHPLHEFSSIASNNWPAHDPIETMEHVSASCQKQTRVVTCFDEVVESVGGFGRYQYMIIIVTQLGYLCVTGSLIAGNFDSLLPYDWEQKYANDCLASDNRFDDEWIKEMASTVDFYSLSLQLHLFCESTYIGNSLFKTATMVGGVFGAMTTGYMADRFGRQPLLLGSLSIVFSMNILFCIFGAIDWRLSSLILHLLGWGAGGFMVVNIVVASECVCTDVARLVVMTINGWPLGLIYMALLGLVTKHWLYYHIGLAVTAFILLIPAYCCVDESARWLTHHQHAVKAHRVLRRMAKINRSVEPSAIMCDSRAIIGSATNEGSKPDGAQKTMKCREYNYMDLLTSGRQLLIHLIAMTYSWLSSSIVSFGIYELIQGLAGNRYLNLILLAVFKQITGLIPLIVYRCLGRKTVLLIAVVGTLLSLILAVLLFLVEGVDAKGTLLLTIFAMLGAGAIDPIWKVNHLYSVELFPTVVRNMARAVCNLGSRVGSAIAPQVVYLSIFGPSVPYFVFTGLVLIQLLVTVFCLPETRGMQMPDSLADANHLSSQRRNNTKYRYKHRSIHIDTSTNT